MAWRSGPSHFASKKTKMFIMSAPVGGDIDANQTFNWKREQVIELQKDVREPYFIEVNGILHFYYFMAGTDPVAFQPNTMWAMQYTPSLDDPTGGVWSPAKSWGNVGEVAWQYHVENQTAYTISYNIDNTSFFGLNGGYNMFNKS